MRSVHPIQPILTKKVLKVADLQVIFLQDVLPITSVTNAAGVLPRTLDLRGADFRTAESVTINEEPSPEFMILNKTQILAQVPVSQTSSIIRTVSVVSSRFTATERSIIKFKLSNHSKTVTGLQALVQIFLKLLLQSPKSDVFAPNLGGGVLNFVGKSVGRNNPGQIISDLTLAVNRTRTQIISLQAGIPTLSPDERLATAELMDANFSRRSSALLASIRLIAQSGRKALANLEV